MSEDILAGAEWQCGSTPPDSVERPDALDGSRIEWVQASVPGTAAGAMLAAGRWHWGVDDEQLFDGRDWWFRTRFQAGPGKGHAGSGEGHAGSGEGHAGSGEQPHELLSGGLATIADVWLNGEHVLRSENMFRVHRVQVQLRAGENELAIRFAALAPLLSQRRPRPRWKSRLVRSQNLRWLRTTLIGRSPGWSRWAAPVGPWRPLRLLAGEHGPRVIERQLHARCVGEGGEVSLSASLSCERPPSIAALRVDGAEAPLELTPAPQGARVRGTARLERVERWWPHTHGQQRRYRVELVLDGVVCDAWSVGFRTLRLDRAGGAFSLEVNDTPIFCRGACWLTPEPVSLAASGEQQREAVLAARRAGMNMLRVPAYTWYEDDAFWEACDELGVLVWQDCMLAAVDPPEDEQFVASLQAELRDALASAAARPSLALLCGSSETFQQPAMLGLEPGRWGSGVLEAEIPALLAKLAPEVPYIPSSPSGGELPFDVREGVAHYFGVGAYMRPLTDARLAGVRFAAECLAFATPPEPETVLEAFGGSRVAGHDPRWKSTVARDAGTSWDFEDVRDHYVAELFGVDPRHVRYADPDLALDLGRAAVAEAITSVLTSWRRADSGCAGALVLSLRDLWPGAGWGMIDALGRPKSSWYAFAQTCAPQAVLVADGGLSGPRVHVFNDRGEPLAGRLALTAFDAAGNVLERAETEIELGSHDARELGAWTLFGGFRDLGAAYRFGPAVYDVLAVELLDEGGVAIASAAHPLSGPRRPRLPEVGLQAQLRREQDGWALEVSTRSFAQYVAFDLPGFVASDAWFHLAPGSTRIVALRSHEPDLLPSGWVRALNSVAQLRVAAPKVGALPSTTAGNAEDDQ